MAVFIGEWRGGSGSVGGHLSAAPGDEWRQRERGKKTQLTWGLLASADEHKGERRTMSIV